MIRKAVLFCIGLCSPLLLLSQGQGTHWYFGEQAGLKFNPDGSVIPLDNGRITTYEGCASISDTYGNLLFYTDGIDVYDREHNFMENGYGLLGDSSSTQSAIIVPNPEDPDIFYIFTVDTTTNLQDSDFGMHYSVVDLSNNNGMGAVTLKNANLLDETSEKIAAVIKNCFDRSIWVITMAPKDAGTRFFDTIYSFEVTAAGVKKTPVKSTIPGLLIEDPRGYLKISPDGSILASANQTSGLYLFDYDISTGNVTGFNRITIPGSSSNPYGIEFSPNGRFLYVHAANEVIPPRTNWNSLLLQYDLEAADIQSSIVILDNRPMYRGALQLGENGKIYRTISNSYYEGTAYLGVINNPNAQGLAADYQHDAIDLQGKITHQGLPPFVQSFIGGENLVRNDDGTLSDNKVLCEGESFILEADNIAGAVYLWRKDGILDPSITGFRYDVSNAMPEDSGDYEVEIILPDPTECPILGESSVEVIPNPSSQFSLTECDYDIVNSTDGLTVMDLMASSDLPGLNFEFFESIADRDANNPIQDPGSYRNTQPFTQTLYFRTTNELGCTYDGQFDINIVAGLITPAAMGTINSCDEISNDDNLIGRFDLDYLKSFYPGLNVTFYSSLEDLANNENALTDQLVGGSGTLYAKKGNGVECLGTDIIDLVVHPSEPLEIADTYFLCQESPELIITVPGRFNEFSWFRTLGEVTKKISSNASLRIIEPGDYRLEARVNYGTNGSERSCLKQIKFKVNASDAAIIEEIEIRDLAANNIVQVIASGEGEYEYSLDGISYQDSPYFDKVEPGIMTAYVRDKNGCGIASREITVLGYPKFFTPNGDGINDFWQITGVNDEFEPDALIAIYDRFGSMVAQISPSSPGWSGKSNAFMYPASDYWFRVILRNGREFKGHFALKR